MTMDISFNDHHQNNDAQKEWRVQVFRHSSNGLTRLLARNESGEELIVTVQVCRGFIVLPLVNVKMAVHSNKQDGGGKSKPTMSFVCRRRDMICIGGNGRTRKLILKFRDETECKEFSDAFVRLHPPNCLQNDENAGRRRMDESGAALTYVARLLNEPDFVSYVNDLESYLLSSEDGQQMLDSLVT